MSISCRVNRDGRWHIRVQPDLVEKHLKAGWMISPLQNAVGMIELLWLCECHAQVFGRI